MTHLLATLAALVAQVLAALSGTEPARWDPRDVDQLPVSDALAPVLPSTFDVPASAPSVAERPLPAAVLSVAVGRSFLLLGADGSWRSVPSPHRHAQGALSPDGTGLVVQWDDTVTVWDLPSGTSWSHPFPEDLVPWDFTRTRWIDGSTLLIDDYRGGWRVDAASGAATRTPYPTEFQWTVDPRGEVVEVGDPYLRAVATSDQMVGLTGGGPRMDLVVVDRQDAEVVAQLSVRDVEANYSNWALMIVASRDDGTVLLWVAVPGRARVDGWRLVSWDPRTDALAVVSRTDAAPTDPLSFATDLLR